MPATYRDWQGRPSTRSKRSSTARNWCRRVRLLPALKLDELVSKMLAREKLR